MKKLFSIVFIVISLIGFGQVPQFINYQGVARNSSGTALANTPLSLTITISNTLTTYSEQHTSVMSNSVGIFVLQIGNGSPISGTFPTFNWAAATNIVVIIDAGSGPQTMPSQPFASVPYALYAEKVAGSSSLPTGTVTGQTLFWDQTTTNWKVDKNLTNDGGHVGVGLLPAGLNNKLHVVTGVVSDSAAIFGYHFNAGPNHAGVRGVAIGAAAASTFQPISGGNFIGFNYGGGNNASAVGASGQAYSLNSDAIGVVAIGTSSNSTFNNGRSVGLYASAQGAYYPNTYSGVFDRGKVLINDTLLFPSSGNTNDILIKQSNGKAVWTNPSALPTGPWGKSGGNTFLNSISDNVGIGNSTPSAKLEVVTSPTNTGNGLTVTSLNNGGGLQINKISSTGDGLAVNMLSGATGTAVNISNLATGNEAIYINHNSNTADGIHVKANGLGAGVFADNISGGNAFRAIASLTSGTAAAVFAQSNGKGFAVHAKLGSTVGGASNVALAVEEGHIRHIQAIPVTVNTSSVGAGFIVGAISVGGGTDVKGEVVLNGVAFSGTPGAIFKINVTFNKVYTSTPIVVVTPTIYMDPLKMSYYVTSTSAGFSVWVTAGSVFASQTISFNYMVIE
jgi:hypothetical protein